MLFVDGLRYDLGRLLGESLEATFAPRFTTPETLVDAAGLRSAFAAQGGQVLEGEAFPIPNRPDAA